MAKLSARAAVFVAVLGVLFVSQPHVWGTTEHQFDPPKAVRYTFIEEGDDTTEWDENIKSYLDSAGYQASYYHNQDSEHARNQIDDAAIVSFTGHGGWGWIRFWNGAWPHSFIASSPERGFPSDPYIYVPAPIWPQEINDLGDLRLAVFNGCDTAGGQGGTSLLDTAVYDRGVDCALGFASDTFADRAEFWDRWFFSMTRRAETHGLTRG